QFLTCLTQQELESYLKSGVLPLENKLRERFQSSAILFENGKIKLFIGHEVTNLENMLFLVGEDEIKGTVAFQGKVIGTCRLVHDPFKAYEFNDGDILVTGMTRPEFTPFMKKAGAIVTDVGGLLCHAAITAREIKIPCIVGTEKATKTFKDGDRLEVDAEKGIIRKINCVS
ncbi:MAG: PEP-utilizing enzyme, partial [Nanoarchaeota archaeon]